MIQTRHTRVAGIGSTRGSQRAMNLLFAIRDIPNRTDIENGRKNILRMEQDMRYVEQYEGYRIPAIKDLSEQATEKEIAQILHSIARRHRSDDFVQIGAYIGLRLMVRSEYNLAGGFDHNSFFVEGKSGLKYRYGISGALPLSYADTLLYPKATLDKLPTMIEQQQRRIAKLESELPTLQEIARRKRGKTEELERLKEERCILQKHIDESLKEAEQPTISPVPNEEAA